MHLLQLRDLQRRECFPVLIGAVANIILDPIFIFGLNMDVRGAALATIISQALSCIWVVGFPVREEDIPEDKEEKSGPDT